MSGSAARLERPATVDGLPEIPGASTRSPSRTRSTRYAYTPGGTSGGVAVAGLLAVTVVATRLLGVEVLGVLTFPIAGVVAAVAFGRRCERVHPDEPWLPRLVLYGTLAKLVGSLLRFITLTGAYDNVGDATRYDIEGRKFVAAWTGNGPMPVMDNIRQTNFIKLFTGGVYYLFGQSLLGAFLLCGLLAVVGSYFWYRALVCAVPQADKRLFLICMMFAPSVVFWPSSLGKEALMQLAMGAMAWAIALLYSGQIPRAIPLVAGGGWLLWVVRPHLLALVAVAGAIPYFVGHIRRGPGSSTVGRPVAMVVVGLVTVLTVTTGAKFLGIDELSVEAVQSQLDHQSAQSLQGGSSFEGGSSSLNPVNLPYALVTVLFRPLPWEVRNPFQLAASLEGMALLGFVVYRFDSLRASLRRWRKDPFFLYCMVLLVLFAMIYSSFANFGLLSRQRSLALPALYALLVIEPWRLRQDNRAANAPEPARSGG